MLHSFEVMRTPCGSPFPTWYRLTYERTWISELGLWKDFLLKQEILGAATPQWPQDKEK